MVNIRDVIAMPPAESSPDPHDSEQEAPAADAAVERIIDAALEEMAEKGPTRARMGDIARRAGVSSATLYRRFAAKQELLQSVMVRETVRFIDAIRKVAAAQETAEQTVAECFVFAVEYMRERTIMHQLIEAEPELVLPQLTTQAGPMIEAATGFMLEVNAENLFVEEEDWRRDIAEVRLELVTRIFISLLLTPGYAIDVSTPEASREFARRHLVPLVVQASSPQATRPSRRVRD